MPNQNENTEPAVNSLDDLIVTYDMKALLVSAQAEFECASLDRELLAQETIGKLFNLNEQKNARN